MSHYDKLAASAPVNRAAAMQLGGGYDWKPSVDLEDWSSDCPPLKSSTYYQGLSRNDNWVDYRGTVHGRLTVIGVADNRNSKRSASWVCRCKCGGYCQRSAKSLRDATRGGNSFVPFCGWCAYNDRLRTGEFMERKEKRKRGKK